MTPEIKATIAKVRYWSGENGPKNYVEALKRDREIAELAHALADALEAESERLEIALTAIEERPHEMGCGMFTDAVRPCDCWKSRVAAQLNTPTK